MWREEASGKRKKMKKKSKIDKEDIFLLIITGITVLIFSAMAIALFVKTIFL